MNYLLIVIQFRICQKKFVYTVYLQDKLYWKQMFHFSQKIDKQFENR